MKSIWSLFESRRKSEGGTETRQTKHAYWQTVVCCVQKQSSVSAEKQRCLKTTRPVEVNDCPMAVKARHVGEKPRRDEKRMRRSRPSWRTAKGNKGAPQQGKLRSWEAVDAKSKDWLYRANAIMTRAPNVRIILFGRSDYSPLLQDCWGKAVDSGQWTVEGTEFLLIKTVKPAI